MNSPIIRKIQAKDNEQVERVIRKVLIDLGVPKVGTAYEDEALKNMYEAYAAERSDYFVITANGKVIGCAGIAPLDNYKGNVCELQKMYFLEEARGLGLGAKMIAACIAQAKEYGFEAMYLETMPYMKAAQKLYKKNGFEYIDAPMGCTGHSACPVYMLRKL
jgi:putative acetyltransferase